MTESTFACFFCSWDFVLRHAAQKQFSQDLFAWSDISHTNAVCTLILIWSVCESAWRESFSDENSPNISTSYHLLPLSNVHCFYKHWRCLDSQAAAGQISGGPQPQTSPLRLSRAEAAGGQSRNNQLHPDIFTSLSRVERSQHMVSMLCITHIQYISQ